MLQALSLRLVVSCRVLDIGIWGPRLANRMTVCQFQVLLKEPVPSTQPLSGSRKTSFSKHLIHKWPSTTLDNMDRGDSCSLKMTFHPCLTMSTLILTNQMPGILQGSWRTFLDRTVNEIGLQIQFQTILLYQFLLQVKGMETFTILHSMTQEI
jgi:hypothetical protein